MKNILTLFLKFIDPILGILLIPSLFYLKLIRRLNIKNFILSNKLLKLIGVFPIINSFYEPKFIFKKENSKRYIKIDMNEDKQLNFIEKLNFHNEIKIDVFDEIFKSKHFGTGDIEFWYQIIRKLKPKKIIEIGSGTSTQIAEIAIKKNSLEEAKFNCDYTIIDPYPSLSIKNSKINIIRQRVENLDIKFFEKLYENDILFIDSSHIIRPNEDVLYLFLNLLPSLNNGVIVHIHDIFTPNDYPYEWISNDNKLWNEQYLLESMLINSKKWEIVASLNYLKKKYFEKLIKVCPYLTKKRNPGSFYIKKLNE